MTIVERGRLETLAAFLEAFPADDPTRRFDLSVWRNDCGTAACACGWAATIPAFAAAGFSLSSVRGEFAPSEPVFGGRRGFDAVTAFFGVHPLSASYLFGPTRYRNGDDASAAGVAERIRDFLTNVATPAP